MAHFKLLSTIFLIATAHESTARIIQPLNPGAQVANGYFRHHGGNEKNGGGSDGNGGSKLCGETMSGSWAKGVNFSYVPDPPQYEKAVDLHLEFYVYDDLWFGTISVNITREHDSWQHQYYAILCDMGMGCPWKRGETKKFSYVLASPSTYIDKGSYRALVAVYNEDDLILLVDGHCTF